MRHGMTASASSKPDKSPTDWRPGDPLPHVHDHVVEMLTGEGMEPEAIRALLDFDTANFLWHRIVVKGEMLNVVLRKLGAGIDAAHFQALTAMVRIRCGVGRPATEPTIGLVAEEMTVDPSRASRLVADLVAGGLVSRGVAQDDGRRSVLALTDTGKDVLAAFRREKWEILLRVFRDWDPETITHFARGIRAYSQGMQAVLAEVSAEAKADDAKAGAAKTAQAKAEG